MFALLTIEKATDFARAKKVRFDGSAAVWKSFGECPDWAVRVDHVEVQKAWDKDRTGLNRP